MHKIKKLPPEIQKQICAGEVIMSPYNALKELLENSIDAKSTFINVQVSKDNLNFEIHDNGTGIYEKDFENLAVTHYTSKIITNDYLYDYGTDSYGFRGEALASIRCISHLIIKSKTADSVLGYIRDFKEESGKQIAMNNGTSIYVNKLFYNNKLREKVFTKKLTVFKSLQELVCILSIKHCSIKFQLNDVFYNQKTINIQNNICIDDFYKSIENFDCKNESINTIENDEILHYKYKTLKNNFSISSLKYYKNDFLTFFFTPITVTFKTCHCYIFINNRLITNKNIKTRIMKKYSTYIPKGTFPYVYLEVQVPPKHIDVNVHPSKKEVLFEYEKTIIEVLENILESELNEPQDVYSRSIDIKPTQEIIYSEINTLEDCKQINNLLEYKLLSISELKDDITVIDNTFIKELAYVGQYTTTNSAYLLLQYNQYLLKCDLNSLMPIFLHDFFLFNFGNFESGPCNFKSKIKNQNDKKVLQKYFQIEFDVDQIVKVPLIDTYLGNAEKWKDFEILETTEKKVFNEIFQKLIFVYQEIQFSKNLFSIMKKNLKCTSEVLKCFTIIKTLKDFYKNFDRC